jgi:hypothetical protein
MEGGMTDGARDQSTGRMEAERRELEAAGWEAKGRGARTIWRPPAGGRWYAHYQALEMLRKAAVDSEHARLLREHGFERAQVEGSKMWERYEQDSLRLYVRGEALRKARKEEK